MTRPGTDRARWTTPDLLLGSATALVGPPFALVFGLRPWAVVVVIATFLALVPLIGARRTRPSLSVVGCLVAVAVLVVSTPFVSLHVALVVAVLVHTAAARLPVRWMWLVIGVVSAMLLVTGAFRPRTPALVIGVGVCLAVVAMAAMTGLLSRRERERTDQLLVLQRSEERAAVARELHDVVAHSLGVIAAQAEGARYAGGKDPAVAQESLERIAVIARTSLRRARAMVLALRSEEDELAFGSDGFDQIPELVRNAGRAGTTVTADLPDPWPEADMLVQATVNRIVTEGLSNAMRHGSGSASLDVRVDGSRLMVELRNPYSGSHREAGIGLVGLQERAQLVGGRLDSAPDPEQGVWRLTAEVPLT